MTKFLRNFWYVAGWAEDASSTPLRRTIIGEPVVLYRLGDGSPVALLDICPHRWVPLSRGKLVGDRLQCGYHGLEFDRDGHCVGNPYAGGAALPQASVRRFPLVEKFGLLWIWMGAPEQADEGAIPDFALLADPAMACAKGTMRVEAHVDLIVDNLLDLSHVQYLHPALATPGGAPAKQDVKQSGNTVWSLRWRENVLPNGLMSMFWPADKRGDSRSNMRWDPPGVMLLDVGITDCGAPAEQGIYLPSVHLLTPETETSTHYFWAFSRNARVDDHELTDTITRLGIQAFQNEDKPVIEDQQTNTPIARSLGMKQVLLAPDAAAVRVRRLMSELFAAEA